MVTNHDPGILQFNSVTIVLIAILSGCNSSPSPVYRVINQKQASREAQLQVARNVDLEKTLPEAPADAMTVENNSMMSIHPEPPASASYAPVSALAISNPLKVELLISDKTFSKDRKTGALKLTFDDVNLLKVLNMDPVTDDAVSHMPIWMTSLEGQTVRVRGYMYPPHMAEGLERFVLLRDNLSCCFGPGAKIYDHILIEMKPGTTAGYVPIQQSLDVVGKFKIKLESAGDSVFGLYVIEDASVILR